MWLTLSMRILVGVAWLILPGTAAWAQNYSLVIGIDGMGSYGLEAASTTNMHAVMDGSWAAGYQGAYSLSAYAGGVVGSATQQATSSGPGWSTLHNGVWTDDHGVTDNGASFASGNFAAYPSYLKVLKANLSSVSTSGIVSWNPIDANIFAPGNGSPDIDSRTGTNESDALSTSTAVTQIGALATGANAALFVHLDNVDIVAHASGAYSAANLNAIQVVDSQVGQMLNAIKSRPTFASENWQVMVVSDHGHVPGGGHGGQSPLERSVPILVSTKTLARGIVTAATAAPSQIDVAPTVLDHFGVERPAYMEGQSLLNAVTPTVDQSLGEDLVSHLSFDGHTNGSYAGSGGTVHGAVTFEPGKFGQAGKVATYGAGRVTLNDDIAAGFGTASDFALSMWMKYDSAASDPAFFSNKDWDSGANTGINLAYLAGSSGLDVNTKTSAGLRRDVEPYGGFEAAAWHHVLLNVDRDGRTTLYVDGALFGDNATSIGSFDGAFNFTFFNDGTGSYTAGGLSLTNLMIDEFSAWKRLLSADEIAYLSVNPLSAALDSAVDGDFDADGEVDGADFLVWQRGGSTIPLSRDDLALWKANFGSTAELAAGSAAVPEPAMCIVLAAAAAPLLRRRRGAGAGYAQPF
jgi:hypothetical protein